VSNRARKRSAAQEAKRYQPAPEQAAAFDDGYEPDPPACKRCHGDGMDPWCDYVLPCPECGGSML
jgi:hypothetical protein